MTNLSLMAGLGLDLVVVSAPMAKAGRGVNLAGGLAREAGRAQLDREALSRLAVSVGRYLGPSAQLQLLAAGGTKANPEVMERIRTSTTRAVMTDDNLLPFCFRGLLELTLKLADSTLRRSKLLGGLGELRLQVIRLLPGIVIRAARGLLELSLELADSIL